MARAASNDLFFSEAGNLLVLSKNEAGNWSTGLDITVPKYFYLFFAFIEVRRMLAIER